MIGHKHIVLFGFKNTGKSTIGQLLAGKLHRSFIDLDQQVEQSYQAQNHQSLSCREIFKRHGENFFREYETHALQQVVNLPFAVIALGGGALLREENRILVRPHWLVRITAAPEVVYARIMTHGKPAYFPEDQDPKEFFQRLCSQHETAYASLANFSVDNTHSATYAVALILKTLGKADEIHSY